MKKYYILLVPLVLIFIALWYRSISSNTSIQELNDNLYNAFWENDKVKMQKLIDQGADVNYKPDDMSATEMLTAAIMYNDVEMVDFLLSNGANATITLPNGRNLFSYTNNINIGKMLLERGVQPSATDHQGNNSLHRICVSGKFDNNFLEFLLSHGVSVDDKNRQGMTPLHIACMMSKGDNKLQIIKKLLTHKANVNIKDNSGTIPLQYAAMRDNPETIKILIKEGSNINHQDIEGNTALHYANALKTLKNVHLLLANGADSTIKNNAGQLYNEIAVEVPKDTRFSPGN